MGLGMSRDAQSSVRMIITVKRDGQGKIKIILIITKCGHAELLLCSQMPLPVYEMASP